LKLRWQGFPRSENSSLPAVDPGAKRRKVREKRRTGTRKTRGRKPSWRTKKGLRPPFLCSSLAGSAAPGSARQTNPCRKAGTLVRTNLASSYRFVPQSFSGRCASGWWIPCARRRAVVTPRPDPSCCFATLASELPVPPRGSCGTTWPLNAAWGVQPSPGASLPASEYNRRSQAQRAQKKGPLMRQLQLALLDG